jgi:purine-nucleoside phosphorylase
VPTQTLRWAETVGRSTLGGMPVHLRAEPSDYAPAVLVPGDPKRARYIAETFFEPGARCVNEERGMLGFTGTYKGQPISVQSVGMGCASAAIYYSELIQLGATRIVRVGTAGGLADGLQMADTVVAISATADDPIIGHLTNGEPHSPTASWSLVERSVALARQAGATVHVGPIVSSALFYDPRQGMMQRWKERGHLAVEMEAAVLYTLGAIHKIETLCLVTISDLIAAEEGTAERISDDDLKLGVDRMMAVACDVAIS